MSNKKYYLYFDQGGMFGSGTYWLGTSPLEYDGDDEYHIAFYKFAELQGYYALTCAEILLRSFKEKYGLNMAEGSIDLHKLLNKRKT